MALVLAGGTSTGEGSQDALLAALHGALPRTRPARMPAALAGQVRRHFHLLACTWCWLRVGCQLQSQQRCEEGAMPVLELPYTPYTPRHPGELTLVRASC